MLAREMEAASEITCLKKADGPISHPLFHGDLPRNMPVREKAGEPIQSARARLFSLFRIRFFPSRHK